MDRNINTSMNSNTDNISAVDAGRSTNGNTFWTDGVMGVLIGDALGNPVQFMSRSSVQKRGLVKGMEAGGVFKMPAGSWTDDGSMTLATLDSLIEKGTLDFDDIMERFIRWDSKGEYTPFGKAYDQGLTCMDAIDKYIRSHNWASCGKTGEKANGNGGLMRIMPVCLYAAMKEKDGTLTEKEAVHAVHNATLLTHNHLRACTASGIYYFMCKEILKQRGFYNNAIASGDSGHTETSASSLRQILQRGMDAAVSFYRENDLDDELVSYARMKDLESYAKLPADKIRSSGYVVHTLEASIWTLITTDNLEEALLQGVNLGDDADTVGAIAGGLAGLYYGYDSVPAAWKDAMQNRAWLEEMCRKAAEVQF